MSMPRKCLISIKTLSSVLFLFICNFVFGFSQQVFSGLKELPLRNTTKLEITSSFEENCNLDIDVCLPYNKLALVKDGYKYDFSNLIRYWNNSTYVYFVYLKANDYLSDLDGDGNLEFALFPMIAGSNPVTDAYIYSINGRSIVFYGMGKFHYERGPYVQNIIKGKWVEPKL